MENKPTKIEKLSSKIDKLNKQILELEDQLYKETPHKPMIDEDATYNTKSRKLTRIHMYYCSYCGERVKKNVKRHRCGQFQDWTFLNQE